MLKTFSSRKRHFFPAFLALFYFVLGVHVLHPHYHGSNHVHLDCVTQHGVYEIQQHSVASNFFANGERHSCPICGFLAVSSVLEIGAERFFNPSYPDQQAVIDCQLSTIPVHLTGFHIRGPPTLFS